MEMSESYDFQEIKARFLLRAKRKTLREIVKRV